MPAAAARRPAFCPQQNKAQTNSAACALPLRFFAAALQEYNWATVVGEQTTGKARSQITLELSDGSAVHISTHKYLTPNRVDLAETGGVTPDVAVAQADEQTDTQLETAINALG